MTLNKKIVSGIFVLAFLIMSAVPVCGQSDGEGQDCEATLRWMGMAEDKVGKGNHPNPDGDLGFAEGKGDCDGDGEITAADALCALMMAVGKIPEDLVMDVNGDGEVSSGDAREILKKSVKTSGGGKEPLEENCDSKHLSLCDNKDDCKGAGGYWHNNQCNEEEEKSEYGDLIVDDSDKEFIKNLESFDLDNDGSDDKYVYKYEREEVAENLFLDKSYEFDSDDSGLSGKIILKFENTGDKAVEYSHIEVIPKSFAESVDDLEFSVPPDEIIETDPILRYDLIQNEGVRVIEITRRNSGVVGDGMDVDTLTKMTCEEKHKWINKQIGPYKDTIKKTAKKHNIPPRLLATVILNELGDYNTEDQIQEVIPNIGSVGIAQINVHTAIKHNLVDVSDKEIKTLNDDNYFDWYWGVKKTPWVPIVHVRPGTLTAHEYLVWERLNQPEIAIEAAAREIEFILNNTNKNLDKTWAKNLLTGPIDRSDLYKNLKLPEDLNFPDPYQVRIEKEGALAVLVVGPYNTDTLISENFNLPSAYEHPDPENRKVPYYNARTHAASARVEFTEMLAKQHMFEDGEYTKVGDICCGHVNEKCCPNEKCYAMGTDTGLMCKDGKCVKCGVINRPCCPDDKCMLYAGKPRLTCKDDKCQICGDQDQPCCKNEGQECISAGLECNKAGKCVKKEKEPEEGAGADTSDDDLRRSQSSLCPIPIPNEASHIVEDYSEYWSTPNGFVGPCYLWYDREKTKKHSFDCYNIEGELQGVSKCWYDDGTPEYEWNYKDGKTHGVCKSWYEDGTLNGEWNYKDGKTHGVCKSWYEDGTLCVERNYKDDKLHGVCKEWYEDGTLKEERHYKDGQTRVVKLWREDGTPHIEKNYKDGKKHGVYKLWYEDGTLNGECNYKDGEKHGVCKSWYANGKLIEECNYEEGNCVSCVHGHC